MLRLKNISHQTDIFEKTTRHKCFNNATKTLSIFDVQSKNTVKEEGKYDKQKKYSRPPQSKMRSTILLERYVLSDILSEPVRDAGLRYVNISNGDLINFSFSSIAIKRGDSVNFIKDDDVILHIKIRSDENE